MYAKVSQNWRAKELTALKKLSATYSKFVKAESKQADEVFAAMPGTFNKRQREYLRREAAVCVKTGEEMSRSMRDYAAFLERLAKCRKLSAADRPRLRRHLANRGTLEFAGLAK